MMRLKIIGMLIAISIFAGCASSLTSDNILPSAYYSNPSEKRETNWQFMVGNWYGSQKTRDGGVYSWIIRRDVNGLYKLEGKIVSPTGDVKKEVEVGEWGMGGTIYFTICKGWIKERNFAKSNPADPYYRDVYRILELTHDLIRYEHLDGGGSFTVRRVQEDFQMPE
jgi:hypothetical protein